MITRVKYPRTPHLPWSPGATADDRMLDSVAHFLGREVIVTEKLDGECSTLYSDGWFHARSLDGRHHPSQSRIKSLAASLVGRLSDGLRVCGENLYAEHSISYDRLTSYFYVFSVWDGATCLSWDETEMWAEELGLPTVPVLYQGTWDEAAIRACWTGKGSFSGEQEGYVVRVRSEFNYANFGRSLAKFVRANHVTTDQHWREKPLVPNKLAGGVK